MAESVRVYGSKIIYEVVRRNVKYPRLEFKTGNLLIVLPKDFGSHENILEKHNAWINKKNSLINAAIEEASKERLDLKRTDGEFKDFARLLVEKVSKELKIKVNKVYFRRMKSKWGSCSPKGNLTLNTLLKYLPGGIVEYVIFHEMAHLIERKHNDRFWRIVSKKFKDFQEKEGKLLVYWFLVQKTL